MTFKEANERIGYEYSWMYGSELDPKLYDTDEDYENAVEEDKAKSKEAWETFGITTEESICEHCYYSGICEVFSHLKDREIITSCKQGVHEDYDPDADKYTEGLSYLDLTKGR